MRIAFYAPMKPPDHAVPSGDREMARNFVAALRLLGHEVEVVSRFQSFSSKPSLERLETLRTDAGSERARIAERWQARGAPHAWFTYHPYYKSPDLLGPDLCAGLGVAYVTAEASYAGKRDHDAWAPFQAAVARGLRQAALNFAMTRQDQQGLLQLLGRGAPVVHLPPFIDTAPFEVLPALPPRKPGAPVELITVAMMRAGAKLRSYEFLAEALGTLTWLPWRLTIVGDGSARGAVEAAFARLPAEKIKWSGAVAPAEISRLLAHADAYVWPGFDEAYGVAYMEAQAAGLAVAALACGGIPDAVRPGETALLAPADASAADYARLIGELVSNADSRQRLGANGRRFILGERSLAAAARRLEAAFSGLGLPHVLSSEPA